MLGSASASGDNRVRQTAHVAFRVKIELHGEWFERDVVSELLELADESFGALLAGASFVLV